MNIDLNLMKELEKMNRVINKEVEIRGNNYNIDPTSSRNKETTFTTDLIINASNVIINGVELTDKAKFTFDNLTSNIDGLYYIEKKVLRL